MRIVPEEKNYRTKGRRRLSRAQITDILERNAELYKDEDNFASYLVELAIYLVEYEYDREKDTQGNEATFLGQNTTQADKPITVDSESNPMRSKITVHTSRGHLNKKVCPYCGNVTGDALVCPSCHNLTR